MKPNELQNFDWDEVKRRLAAAQEALQFEEAPPEIERRMLDDRAAELAKSLADDADAAEILVTVAFSVAKEQFAIESRYVREITTPEFISSVPGGPDMLVGVTNLRGDITSVIDLRALFQIPEKLSFRERLPVLVLGEDQIEFAIQIDVTAQVRPFRLDEINRATQGAGVAGGDYVLGVSNDAVIVLDGKRLLADTRLYIDESD